ncbi:MAG TPA: SLBB domain-containing protein [Fimbriimonadaceae bacterium]|nr:SLBB domain-containing protein [Fimbriimonadaceae bacterium]
MSLILSLLPFLAMQDASRPPLRLKPGDTIVVTTPYGGEFTVESDGAVYGRGFRAVLEGKTIEEAQTAMREAMRKFVPEDDVYVTLKDVKSDVVFLVGLGAGRGPVPLRPDLTLRQVLAGADLGTEADRTEARLFRSGTSIATVNVGTLLAGGTDYPLKADDVIALAPAAFVRVWVLGQVAHPGEIKLQEGTDVYQAVAAAGGFATSQTDANAVQADEVSVVVRRGPDTTRLPLRSSNPGMTLKSGDTITVEAPKVLRVTVIGEVAHPGEYLVRGATSVLAAVGSAGGVNAAGTLQRVMVFRKGEMMQFDVSAGRPAVAAEQGDVVYVPRNERSYYVLGEVKAPGKYLIKDGEDARVTDALAAAGGLADKGTLRRVYLARPGADGKIVIQQFNFDEYLKDGSLGSNPEIQPGDSLLFGQPKGVTLGNAIQALSAALLINQLIRK